ncbi:MAG: hypothetical protein ACXWRA_15405 [Pseudobdellovibrionaceae bacterium]
MKYAFIIFFFGVIFSEPFALGAGIVVDTPATDLIPDSGMISDGAGDWHFVPSTPQKTVTDQQPSGRGNNNRYTNKPRSTRSRATSKTKSSNSAPDNAPDESANTAGTSSNDNCSFKKECARGLEWNNISCSCVDPSAQGNQNSGEPAAGKTVHSSNMDAAIRKCSQDTDVAKQDCDQDQDAGIQGAQTTLTNFALGITSQLGIAGACSGMAKYIAGANAAVIYFAQNCSNSRSNCVSSCQRAQAAVNTAYSGNMSAAEEPRQQVAVLLDSCKVLDSKVQQATQAIQNMVGTIQSAKACAKQTDQALVSYCASNPTAIGCAAVAATDCSNPSIAASNPICICKRNPGDASCSGALAKANANGGSFDSASVSSSGAGAAPGAGTPGLDNLMGDASWAGNPNLKAEKGASEDVGGKKGGRALLDGPGGAGAGAAGDKGKNGGGTPAQGIAVNAGFHGGGGGGGWGGGSGNGGDGEGTAGRPLPTDAGAKGPNLRDFLPGGGLDPKTVNRGLAGISGPDGITGPHSDIWKKVQNRYQIQVEKSTLMP